MDLYTVQYDLYGMYVMFLMRADPLQGQVGGGWALEIKTFWALWNGIELLGEYQLEPKQVKISRAQNTSHLPN
jgi:hypothetical protein